MSIQIDLSKQSIRPFEDTQNRLSGLNFATIQERARNVMEAVSTRQWMETLTNPDSQQVSRGTIVLLGKPINGWGIFDRYLNTLCRLWNEYPDNRKQMAEAMLSYRESYVPYLPREDYRFVSAKRQSNELPGEWRVDSGIGIERARKLLYAAACAVGLRPGIDIIVFTRTQQIETIYGSA